MSIAIGSAINLGLLALDAVTAAIEKARTIGSIVAKAQAEGREKLTDEEWAAIQNIDDAARTRLVDAISKA